MNRNLLALCLGLFLLPACLSAQGWGLGGQAPWPLTSPMLPPLRFDDPEKPYIAPDGSVRRGYETEGLIYDGRTDFGFFALRPGGKICVDLGGVSQGCDVYLQGGQMRMLLSDGQGRLPFRFELGVGN